MLDTVPKVRLLYERLGLGGLVVRLFAIAISRACTSIYTRHTELLIVKSLSTGPGPAIRDDLRIEHITRRHAGVLRQFNERYRGRGSALTSLRYLRNGYCGFIAYVGDEPAGYWWWVEGGLDPEKTHPCVLRFELALRRDEVYAFDYFIAPPFRNRGTAFGCLKLAYDELHRMGYRTVWGFVDSDNQAARYAYTCLGNTVARRVISHEICSVLLVQGERVFIRHAARHTTRLFDYQLVFSLKPKPDAPCAA